MPKLPHINVAEAFADCVESIGGEVLDRILPQSPTFSNADYVFRGDGVVAELKCLEKDIISTSEFEQRATKMHARWVSEGRVLPPATSTVRMNLRELPEDCALEIIALFKARMEAVVKKANSQIRETKKHLGMPNAKGLLLLVNNGNSSMELGMAFHVLARILKEKFSRINSLVYFSVNHPVRIPGITMPSLPWADPKIDRRDEVDRGFREKLRDAWFAHLSKLTSRPVGVFSMDGSDPSAMDDVTFIR